MALTNTANRITSNLAIRKDVPDEHRLASASVAVIKRRRLPPPQFYTPLHRLVPRLSAKGFGDDKYYTFISAEIINKLTGKAASVPSYIQLCESGTKTDVYSSMTSSYTEPEIIQSGLRALALAEAAYREQKRDMCTDLVR